MPPHSRRLKYAIALAVLLLALEAVGLTIFRHNQAMGWVVAFVFQILDASLVIGLDCWRASRPTHLRRQWILFAAGSSVYLLGIVLRLAIYLATLAHHGQVGQQIDYSDLLMVLAYIPYFVLVSLPSGKTYPAIFFWIDTVQSVLAGYLLYIQLFSIIPFTHTALHPIPGTRLIAFYNVVGLLRLGVAILRFFASTTLGERRFYRMYCWALSSALVMVAIYNAVAGQSAFAGYLQLLGVVPLLVLAVLIFFLPPESEEPQPVSSGNLLTAFLNTASPALITFSLLVLGINTARSFPGFGMGAIVAAFVLYSLRATILQRSYEQSERSLQEARDRLEELSLKDPLTAVANRRSFDRTLEAEWNRAVRTQDPLSILMIDVDFFKNLNDRYGHQRGDECLVAVASALQTALPRSGDLLARYGGEEFAVILPTTDSSGAMTVAEHMRQAVAQLQLLNQTQGSRYVTLSIGVATWQYPEGGTAATLVEASDRALYKAKQNGRNRIELASPPVVSSQS